MDVLDLEAMSSVLLQQIQADLEEIFTDLSESEKSMVIEQQRKLYDAVNVELDRRAERSV